MAKRPGITIIHGDAENYGQPAELIFTDPPYDMPGKKLARILDQYDAPHLVLITTMAQLLEFAAATTWRLNFDFVIDGVVPKKSRNTQQPNYTHQTGVYMTRPGVKSSFSRKRRQRSDVFEGNGYWPTIFHAPRNQIHDLGYAKNQDMITDLLGSFDIENVIDPFAGSGTTGFAAFDLGIPATLVELDSDTFKLLKRNLRFCSVYGLEVIE